MSEGLRYMVDKTEHLRLKLKLNPLFAPPCVVADAERDYH